VHYDRNDFRRQLGYQDALPRVRQRHVAVQNTRNDMGYGVELNQTNASPNTGRIDGLRAQLT